MNLYFVENKKPHEWFHMKTFMWQEGYLLFC